MDARFKYAAPIALYYSETSPRKDEVTKLIRDFYFGNSTINNDTVASVVNVNIYRFISILFYVIFFM